MEGVLGKVLLISRVVGVAPFLKGSDYRVSQPLVIFAKLFILISAIDFIIISASLSKLFHEKYESLIALNILMMSSKFFVIITTFVRVFQSPERTIRMLRCLKQLDQIDKKVLGDIVQPASEIKLTVIILIYLHVCFILRGCFVNAGKIHETTLNFLFLITHYMINLSELQVSLFARRIMFSFKVINNSLEKLYVSSQILKTRLKHPILAWEKVRDPSCYIRSTKGRLVKTRVEHIEEPVKLIRQCLENYLYLSDVITASMDGDGLLIVTLLILNILHLLTHSYNLALCAFASTSNFNKPNILCVATFWCIVYAVSAIIYMEPYHKTQSEMQKLQLLLMSLKWINLDDADISNELHVFVRVVNINKPKYSPLGIFTLNRLLVVKVFGSLVTYLVIMVTYGPQLDNLNLISD